MARGVLVAGNWKMNLTLEDSIALAASLAADATTTTTVEIAVFPQMPWLLPVAHALRETGIGVGAQNGHPLASGAFTGEVSIGAIAPHCRYILAGHSERRHLFGESDEFVGEKVRATIAAGSRAILCVGETLREREDGLAEAVVVRQLGAGLAGLDAQQLGAVTIAYEPVWAIGTGIAATPDDAQAMSAVVRRWIAEHYSHPVAQQIRILYGGSVTPENAAALFALADVDGGLVGGASLKAESFLKIVAAAVRTLDL
ncbi:MAG: triose-phosphate isomerase [Chloroflexi bacterium]|nr:MAG: triose-phosphate isomerase [Chloroflexota bacterium]